MQTGSNYSPLPPSSSINSRKYLIVRSQRRSFFLRFLLMTFVGWVVGGIASIALEKVFVELLPAIAPGYQQRWLLWSTNIASVLFALIFGADQGLVIHKYSVSGWWWMLATSFGWIASSNVSNIWIEYISNVAILADGNLLPSQTLAFTAITTGSYILSGIWLGLLQWLVLHKYVISSWKWIFIPSLSFLCISISLIAFTQIQEIFPILTQSQFKYLGEQIITALMLGIVPGIALCTLRIKPI